MAIINAIKNGNFEAQGSWTLLSPAAIVSDGNAMNSSWCLRFINRATGGLQQTVQTMPLVKGSQYDLYFWAKRTGRMDVWAAYAYYDANGVRQTVHSPSMLNTVTGSYTRQSWSFTVPSNALSPIVDLYINSGGNPGDTATAWIDNVELWGEEYIIPLPDPGPHPAGYNHIVNGKFENTDAWQFVSPASIVTDGTNAMEGTRCLRLPYRSAAGMQYAYQSVNLVPSKEYILSFYAKRSGRLDVWAGYSYTDINGSYQRVHGPSLLSQMPDNGGYRRQEYRFTVPSTASSNYCVYIHGGNNPSDVGVSAYVDDVVLVRADGSGGSGGGSQGSDDFLYADVVVNSDGLKVRPTPSTAESPIGYHPNGRLIVLKDIGDTDWYKCRWQDQEGYVSASFLNNLRLGSQENPQILLDVANQEMQADHNGNIKFYYQDGMDSDTEWCHYFADWITAHCLWPDGTTGLLPRKSNCKDGVIYFLDHDAFYFVNATYKSQIWAQAPDMDDHMDQPGLRNDEANYVPSIGDYVYFHAELPETSAHVGIVIGRDSARTTITTIEGNTDGDGVNMHTFAPDSENCRFNTKILGFGSPGYAFG